MRICFQNAVSSDLVLGTKRSLCKLGSKLDAVSGRPDKLGI